jgi:hypothetical protein
MKRFWRTCSKRITKKYFPYFYQDGVVIKYDAWDARMKILQNLRSGDLIYIPYIKEWGQIKMIYLHWKPVENKRYKFHGADWEATSFDEVKYYGPKHHKVVSNFVIKAVSNDGREFWIYDFDHFMIEGVPFDNSWVAFNRAAGLHPAIKHLPNNLSQVRTRGVK